MTVCSIMPAKAPAARFAPRLLPGARPSYSNLETIYQLFSPIIIQRRMSESHSMEMGSCARAAEGGGEAAIMISFFKFQTKATSGSRFLLIYYTCGIAVDSRASYYACIEIMSGTSPDLFRLGDKKLAIVGVCEPWRSAEVWVGLRGKTCAGRQRTCWSRQETMVWEVWRNRS